MAKLMNLIKVDQADKALNKEQRRFNDLVQKISALRENIRLIKALDLELRRIGDEIVKPVEHTSYTLLCEWIMLLHKHPARKKLSNKLAERFILIMLEEIENTIRESQSQDTRELEELYALYDDEGRNFNEVMEDSDLEEKNLTAQMMNMMFGMDIAAEDLDNPEKMQEKLKAKQQEFEGFEQKRQAKRQKIKTNTQIAAEEKRLAAEISVKKTTKQIYLDLVRHFHPDREPDDTKRAEKTEIMQQITGAYEADDHLTLLELQMRLLNSKENVFAEFDNAQLKYFNQTLQKQVFELEQELFFSSPENNGNIYGHLFSPVRTSMLRRIEQYTKSIKLRNKDVQFNIRIVKDEKVFKAFIRDYELSYW